LKGVLEEIIAQVSAANAGIVVVDSFRTLARKAASPSYSPY
jgi:predicted ATP-dependent serine protease